MRIPKGFKHIGDIGVDSGLCWIGDPCYVMHKKEGKGYPELGKNWQDFCELLHLEDGKRFHHKSFGILGVATETGFGDGIYPVYAKIEKTDWGDRVTKVMIDFNP